MSKILVEAFGGRISKQCANKAALQTLIHQIQMYFDKNSATIYGPAPHKKLLFTDTEKGFMYDFTTVRPEEVKEALSRIPFIQKSWVLLNDPFVILSTLVVRELMARKDEKNMNFVIMFMCMKFYSSVQRTFFKYEMNENIMMYTINTLNEKFKYKKLKNNYNVVEEVAMLSHSTYAKQLSVGTDETFVIYIPQMHNRIHRLIKNIAKLAYDNRENKRYLNNENTMDADTGETIDTTNSSAIIGQIAESCVHIMVSQKVNMGLVRIAAEQNNIPFNTLFQTLNEIKRTEKPEAVMPIFSSILAVLFETDKSSLDRICSREFLVNALKQLSVSNTVNPDLLFIKKALDDLLVKYCSKYAMTQRLATKMQYRSALYAFMVYTIILAKCH